MYLAIAQASAASCVTTYPGGYCSDFVNYPFFLASGNSVAAIENTLKAGGIDLLLALNKSTPVDRACVSTFLEWACYTSYPSCDSVDQVTCLSLCKSTVDTCTVLFTTFGKSSMLPNCDGDVQGLTVPYSTSSTCLGASSAVASTGANNTPTSSEPLVCPSFLINDPQYNGSNPNQNYTSIRGQACSGGCCVPCPQILQFYDPARIVALNILNQILEVLSISGSFFILVSYAIFPKKREHPSAMIFYFAIGVFLLHVAHCMDVGSNGTRASCVDNITEASSYNSKACIVQGFLINFAAIYLASWIGLFKLNLFLSITWHLDWFSERYVYLHVATLVVSIGPSIGLVATNGVGTTGFFCVFDVKHSDGIDWMDKLFDHLLDLPSANPDAVDRAIDKYWYE
ncbi:hypothetical protein HDU82_005982 [Entophlyctis luteolus]|nr:hypothetical protein HDU82_005982 [Entophlyctis luteolus]